jgi:hypothetical protein
MLQPDVWGMWLTVIVSGNHKSYLDPAKDWRDPVREKDIMYSGHLLQMISLYETLYDDREFDRPHSMIFEISGDNGFIHTYDHKSLAELIAKQYPDSGYVGIECEPNDVYAECNQHAILGLMQFDQVHGTHLSDVGEQFWAKAVELGYIDPQTHRTMCYYKAKEKLRIDTPYAWSDGWLGVMYNAWDRERVSKLYPTQRDAELPALIDANPERWRVRWGNPFVSYDFGFLAAYAAEVGDKTTAQRLLDYADQHFAPKWVNGRYFYPRHDVITQSQLSEVQPSPLPDRLLGEHHVGPLTNAMLTFARLDPGEGIWNLYNKISVTSFAHSGDPEVVGVRYPEVLITQAYYDKDKRRLAVATVPGTDYRGRTSFGIRNLSSQARYVVTVDGAEQVLLDRGHVRTLGPRTVNATWNAATRELKLDYILAEGRTVLVEAK